ncbi:transcription factor Sox-7-like [Rhopilema esculentum]|uniref:transcription factor Sox-7-like n=1 Tax=Rhopilema esculentum TaxID=499914 RepID=UPI0031D13A0A|eukprot:gene7536-13319_t
MKSPSSELMMLCTQTASQLRSLRSDQLETEGTSELENRLQWLEKSEIMAEEDRMSDDELERGKLQGKKKVPRPMNSFMVFSHLERKRLAEENPELHNADLSKILGRKWKTLTPAQRQPYIDEAERLRVLHTETFPDYKYKPRRRKHPKRNTKKFSTLSANDVNQKTKLALSLDCTLPAMANHPMNARSIAQKSLTPLPSPRQLSPIPSAANLDALLDNPAIPPTPSDSPLANPDLHEVETKTNLGAEKLHVRSTEGMTNFYSFLPPTPELSPHVSTAVSRAAFSFDVIPNSESLSSKENVFQTTSIMPNPVTETGRDSFSIISNLASIYSTHEESQTPVRDDGQLFGDVDRDEFDQYLGASLEKSTLSSSLRNIIAELESSDCNS